MQGMHTSMNCKRENKVALGTGFEGEEESLASAPISLKTAERKRESPELDVRQEKSLLFLFSKQAKVEGYKEWSV